MNLKTKFTEQFQLEHPIVCAPMFLVSTVKLVLAASKAGGIGAFPALNYRPIEKYALALQQIKKESDKPFAVNLIVQASNKYLEQQLELTLEAKTPLIITSLGKPDK
ncbi:MAG: nitronate monooxygenase, partial [Deltaproteobacteria bacterium CG_4_10_14_0_2_um_filter_43_8]